NQGLEDFIATFGEAGYPGAAVPGADRIERSTTHLRENFHRAPVVLVPLVAGRTDGGANVFFQASQWGSIVQAIWSFMLARRGRGSAWTTGPLWREREVGELLGIPHAHFMQTGLFPVAYTLGTKFQPAHRKPVSEVMRWNGFEGTR